MDEQKETNENNLPEAEETEAAGLEQAEESEATEELPAEDEGGGDEDPADELEEKSQEPEADVLDQIVFAETASDDVTPDDSASEEDSDGLAEPAGEPDGEPVEEPAGEPAEPEEPEPFPQETLAIPMASATAAPTAPEATKSGCSFWAYLFTAVVGAFLGVVLTLALLVAMNGTLRFNESAQIRLLEQQIDRSLATAEAEQAGLVGEVTGLDERIEIVTTLESETAATLIIIGADVDSLSGDFSGLKTEAQDLDKRLVIIDERVVTMAAAAEDFDAFLEGLRTLLLEMEDEATDGTATAEATGTVEGPGKSPTARSTAVQPTRTPRPTATPLIPAASSPTPAR